MRDCPNIDELHVHIHSSFVTDDLVRLLDLTKDRLRSLSLFYGARSKVKVIEIDALARYAAAVRTGPAPSAAPLAVLEPIALPRLKFLEVPVCDDGFVRRLRCPILHALFAMGVRAEIRELSCVIGGAFPALRQLGLRAMGASIASAPRCDSLREVTLACNYMDRDDISSLSVAPGGARPNGTVRCPAVLSEAQGTPIAAITNVLRVCPLLSHLTVAGTRIAGRVFDGLARHPGASLLTDIRIADPDWSWSRSDVEWMSGAFENVDRAHPNLYHLEMPLAGLESAEKRLLRNIHLEEAC